MINIYPADAEDFSTLGLAVLQPTECTVEEKAGGLMELEMKHPVDDDLKWTYLQNGCIIKAPCAVREAPIVRILDNVPSGATQTVTRAIYKVRTNTGARLRLRAKPSTSAKIIRAYKPGTEVVQLSKSGDWSRVVIKSGGATGWMYSQYLKFDRNETETVKGDNDQPSTVIESKQTRDQLFRIYSVGRDAETGMVEVKASHIFYDLSGVICTRDYKPENVAADTVLSAILASASAEHGFTFHCKVTKAISGDYTGASIVKALLDPDIGIVPQTGARIIRDNYDVYILPDEVMDRGMEIRHRKNLLGAVLTTDVSGVVTRIRPVGKDKDGNRLLITENNGWVESANKALYPTSRDAEIEYDVSVSTAKDSQIKNNAAARAELKRLAQQDFADGMDAAAVSLDVQLAALENSAEYADYAPLLTVFLYDSVRVIASYVGINAKLRVNGYVYDCLLKRYQDVYVGDISELEQTTYGYEITDGSVSGVKLLPGSVNANSVMRNATIGYAKIAQAAIEQLAADSIVAIRADIHEIVAGSVTTDQLYADLARLAVAQITTANIKEAKIDWAQIAELHAEITKIAKAQITTANINEAKINWAQIKSLSAAIADIATAKIGEAEIKSAQITDLEAEVARIAAAKIAVADIDWAHIKDLVAGTAIFTAGVGDKLHIARLAVTEANMVSLSVGELLVKGQDGSFYSVSVDAEGNIVTEKKQVVNSDVKDLSINAGEKIIEGTVTAACLNANDIFANNATIKQLIAANIDVDTLFAREATITALFANDATVSTLFAKQATIDAINAMDIRGNTYLQLMVGDIAVGGTNLYTGTRDFDGDAWTAKSLWTADGSYSGCTVYKYAGQWNGLGQMIALEANAQYTLSAWLKQTDGGSVRYYDTAASGAAQSDKSGSAVEVGTGWSRRHVTFTVSAAGTYCPRFEQSAAGATLWVAGLKLEKGNKTTDWSPAPEDPAGGLSIDSAYSRVEITKNQVKIVSREMEVAVPSADDAEDDVLRVDADGVHADVVDADLIVSDSVVGTQGAVSYTPANPGALAAILEGLTGKHLTGDVNIVCDGITSGSYAISNVSGSGRVIFSSSGAAVFNDLRVENCGDTIISLYKIGLSNAADALTVDRSYGVVVSTCAINARVGIRIGTSISTPGRVTMDSCTGDCTYVCAANFGSILRCIGASKPTGWLYLLNGSEVYNATPDPTFETATAPSIPTTQTVTVSLSPTQTYTLRGTSNSDGNKLYQGRYSSSQPLRRGVMLFTLPTDLTSADKIDSATLTIKRIGGVGQGGGVSVHVRCFDVPGTLYASKTAYENQTVSIDVTSAVKAMKTNGHGGLMLYNPDTATVSGKSYTASYSRFAGNGESGAPVLKISYRK